MALSKKDQKEFDRSQKISQARMKQMRREAAASDDPRLPGAAKRKADNKKESDRIMELMFGEAKPAKKMGGGMMMKKPVAMENGGKMPMVKKGGKSVPSFAADGVGKMSYGGKMPKKMNMGGKCRGMGAATRGGNFKMG